METSLTNTILFIADIVLPHCVMDDILKLLNFTLLQLKVGPDGETITFAEDGGHKNRRELLARRPSYR